MDDAEYKAVQDRLLQLAVLAGCGTFDLRGFLARVDRAETVGPILDPTLFRDASGNLSKIRRLAEALLPFVDEAETFFEGLTGIPAEQLHDVSGRRDAG